MQVSLKPKVSQYDFKAGDWKQVIDVRSFIQANYTPYDKEASFLSGATLRTKNLWEKCRKLIGEEHNRGGVYDIDTKTVATITAHAPGYIDKENEIIVGLQTDTPLKRAINPWGGIRVVETACQEYGYQLDAQVKEIFSRYRCTHNDGVFAVYTETMKLLRRTGLLTGLPDAYGRGRIIGDYRRVALYGVDRLIAERQEQLESEALQKINPETVIQLREEVGAQIGALKDLKEMAAGYGYDISPPASTAQEAIQWLYFAYLGAIKEQNGAAMSLGRVGAFLDIYLERDLASGVISEEEAQELIDDFVIKLRLARQLRTRDYNALFAADPLWITEAIGGMGVDGRPLVTKTSFRFLQTLRNLGPAAEPNLTILWSKDLPPGFKEFCTQISIETCAIQYENDDLMRPIYGDDYAISCCISAMRVGKDLQYFGARTNLPKALLIALNAGVDELTELKVAPEFYQALPGQVLDYDTVRAALDKTLDWLAEQYVHTMNVIHYMHDKYAYEKLEMALHDVNPHAYMAFGLAGLSVIADSLSAIKYAQVTPVFGENGLIENFKTEGDFPCFGNDDDRVDHIAKEIVADFATKLRRHPAYRNAEHTLSILTITSNVVYGKKTGATPCGRQEGEPFAPGANPMHQRDTKGILASLRSVSKINYQDAQDGVSYTLSVTPFCLGKDDAARRQNLVSLLDGQFDVGGQHLNINVLNRETLEKAMKNPEQYPNLTIRVSGYAVKFIKLTREQQMEVINRTIFQQGFGG
ncbi:formate C-acetyltransferase [candidate division NPL-UPA2 bacterium]|nr:formate C-acetyltransferase [candidate division NPL-UPA2 bacterium]